MVHRPEPLAFAVQAPGSMTSTASELRAAQVVASHTAPSSAPAMAAVLGDLAAALRRGSDATPLRAVDELLERIAALGIERRRVVEAATHWQRRAVASLESPLRGVTGRRALSYLLCSLRCAVDIVEDWPAGSEPDVERLELLHVRCDLAELARSCADAFRGLARERELHFHTAVPARLDAVIDAEKVQRALLNLLFNAFKVTPVGGSIELGVERETTLGEASLWVRDSGAGIPSGLGEAIFDRHRLIDRTGPLTADWLGFNLGASRDCMVLHGGGLRLVPPGPTPGTEFRAHLPLQPPAGAPGGISTPVIAPSPMLPERVARTATDELRIEARLGEEGPELDHRPLVLVVEDSRTMQRIVAEALSDTCSIASALDGRTGLAMAEELRPDLIVTDLGLPELDGAAMVRAIRDQPELERVPILVVSASRDSAQTVQLLRDGVQDFISKPFLVPELEARALNLIDAKRARDLLGDLLGESETGLGRLAAEVSRKQRRLRAVLDELRDARELAESASRVKSNFLRMMSHELKTPLTALLLQQQIVAGEPSIAEGAANVRRGFASMSRSIARLLHIVDTVLEWARVESGRYRPALTPLDLGDVARDAVREVAAQADNKGIVIRVRNSDDLPPLVSDARLVELIAINLLERAINVTGESTGATDATTIDVCAWYQAGHHRLRVTDGSPPMSATERRELLDGLAAPRDLRHRGGFGSGLGLHIVNDLARALGGDVRLADAGSTGNAVDLVITTAREDG